MVLSNLTNSVILWFAWLENNYEEEYLTGLAFECLSKYSLHLVYICLPQVWLFFLLGVCSKSLCTWRLGFLLPRVFSSGITKAAGLPGSVYICSESPPRLQLLGPTALPACAARTWAHHVGVTRSCHCCAIVPFEACQHSCCFPSDSNWFPTLLLFCFFWSSPNFGAVCL